MGPKIIGISGSPVKNSNTDRLVKHILNSSGLESEFVKLSTINVRPCIACLGCTKDNICKVNDDFPKLAEKVKNADAIIIGGYPPYGSVDGFTKAFLERLFSLRHNEALNTGKLAVSVTTGIGHGLPGLEEASAQITHALKLEGMDVLDQLKVTGNAECMTCGFGETCGMSVLPMVFGTDKTITADKFCQVEDQKKIWERATSLGLEIKRRINEQVSTT